MKKTEPITIYYNPRCGKCREAAAIAEALGYQPELIRYLETHPGKEELRGILQKLGMKPHDLIRTKEALYKEKFSGLNLSDEEWLNVLVKHTILIERPIIIRGNKAVVARPAEKARDIL